MTSTASKTAPPPRSRHPGAVSAALGDAPRDRGAVAVAAIGAVAVLAAPRGGQQPRRARRCAAAAAAPASDDDDGDDAASVGLGVRTEGDDDYNDDGAAVTRRALGTRPTRTTRSRAM